MHIEHITLAISIIGLALSVYNFFEIQTQKHFEKACLIESRFLTVWLKDNVIQSIKFRFCLTNISEKIVPLRKIYISYPTISNGKKVLIDQIGQTGFLFEEQQKKKVRMSVHLPNTDEVLPYLLKPGTKYEGFFTIDISCETPLSLNTYLTNEMEITFLFRKKHRLIVPIKYKEQY